MNAKNHYQILGVSSGASTRAIKAAFKELDLKYHPDKHKECMKQAARQRWSEISGAYESINTKKKREVYKAVLRPAAVTERDRNNVPDEAIGNVRAAYNLVRQTYTKMVRRLEEVKAFFFKRALNLREEPSRFEVYERAIASCQEKLRMDPEDVDAHYGLGLLYYKKGNLSQAANCYIKAITLNRYDPDIYYSLGLLRKKAGNGRQAIHCFEKVVQLKPNDADARYRLGDLYARHGMDENAKECIRKLREMRRKDLAGILEDVA